MGDRQLEVESDTKFIRGSIPALPPIHNSPQTMHPIVRKMSVLVLITGNKSTRHLNESLCTVNKKCSHHKVSRVKCVNFYSTLLEIDRFRFNLTIFRPRWYAFDRCAVAIDQAPSVRILSIPCHTSRTILVDTHRQFVL